MKRNTLHIKWINIKVNTYFDFIRKYLINHSFPYSLKLGDYY